MSRADSDSMEFDETDLRMEDQYEYTTGPGGSNDTVRSSPKCLSSTDHSHMSHPPSHSTSQQQSFFTHTNASQPSSAESSAFISHPDVPSSEYDNSNIDMDSSLTSVRESLAQLRVNSPGKDDVSPWRRLRSSHIPAQYGLQAPPVPHSLQAAPRLEPPSSGYAGSGSNVSAGSVSDHLYWRSSPTKPGRNGWDASVNSGARIDELMKQITDYRIQIRLLRQFVQRLVQRLQEDGGDLNLAELHFVQGLLGSPSKSGLAGQDRFDEILKLNEDLYASLETFETEIREQKRDIRERDEQLREKDEEIKEKDLRLRALENALDSILRDLGQSPPLDIDERISVVKSALQEHLQGSMEKIERLLASQKSEVQNLNQRLTQETTATKEARSHLSEVLRKLSQNSGSASTSAVSDSDLSLAETLSTIFALLDTQSSSLKLLEVKVQSLLTQLEAHQDDQENQDELEAMKAANLRAEKVQNEAEAKISLLTSQLTALRQEYAKLNDRNNSDVQVKQLLDEAVDRQRALRAEKIRLSHQVQALEEERTSANATIERLTKKAAGKSADVQPAGDSSMLRFDVDQFQRMLASFEKIADDSSLKEPKKHFQYLQKLSDTPEAIADASAATSHRSVFKYLARAADVLVNDHIKLLLKEADVGHQHSEYVKKLQNRIDELGRANDLLAKQLDDMEGDTAPDMGDTTTTSPRARLRIDELLSRWKSERETRVYENREAGRRVRELENENARLRAELYRS